MNVSGQHRNELFYGLTVDIVLKKDQQTGKLTRGKIEDILTNKSYHTRGIKVRLQTGEIGRVANIIGYDPEN